MIMLSLNPKTSIIALLTLLLLGTLSNCNCSYTVGDDMLPKKVNIEPFLIQNMMSCPQYNGKMGCCSPNNDRQQDQSYLEIDSIFGSAGGGCDLCSINLKRFWCQYACSERQNEFTQIEEGLVPIPDPESPGNTVLVQKLVLRVHADAACDLFNSCKRVPFVASVSAMGSPAGFLNFQGHNAADDAHQDISMKFSYNYNDSLFFTNKSSEQRYNQFTACNHTQPQGTLHGFKYSHNCSCNTCESSCNVDQSFTYTQPALLEGFNFTLVIAVWASVLGFALLLTIYRCCREKKKEKMQ